MSLERTRRDLMRLRAEFDREPRENALHLAHRLAWYSMQLAQDHRHEESEATWAEALEVAERVLEGPGPSPFERTELIRINVGTARSMVEAGRPEQALDVLDKAETLYQQLAKLTEDPTTVLSLRGAILTGKAQAYRALGDAEAELDALCESALELVAGSRTNPLIARSMLQPPLSEMHRMLSQGDAGTASAPGTAESPEADRRDEPGPR